MICWIEDERGFDRRIELSDWRFSASVVGMIKYFEFHGLKYAVEEDCLLYKSEYVDDSSDDKYFSFVENYFASDLYHPFVEDLLSTKQELTPEDIKEINAKLSGNAVMKKIFKGLKYSEESRNEILSLIDENRQELVRETYRMMKLGYRKYANVNLLRTKPSDLCRLVGYNVDIGRKTQGISYNFDFNNFNGRDAFEFDFIPFGFTKGYESIFINNNYLIDDLVRANKTIQNLLDSFDDREDKKKVDIRDLLFFTMKKGAGFIDYDVEIIVKERDEDYFKTLLVRKPAIQCLKIIDALEKSKTEDEKLIHTALTSTCRLSNDEYLPVMKIVIENILNHVYLDGLLEMLLKDKPRSDGGSRHRFLVSQLIRINFVMYKGGDSMKDKSMNGAYAASKQVVEKLIRDKAENKIRSYRQKLVSCLVFKNYNRFIEILLQLSSYSQVPMGFLYDLAEDFEPNKNLAYVFVNGLENFERKEQGGKANE